MTTSRTRFTAPQRLLHWLMAICILSMLFIGVGMVSTITPKYLTLVFRFISRWGSPSWCWRSFVWRYASVTAHHRCRPICRSRLSWPRIVRNISSMR